MTVAEDDIDGLEFVGLSDARPHDKFGIAAAYAHVSLDRDFQSIYGLLWPLCTSEELLTAVYQYEVEAGLTLQPNIKFIRRPGGGATDPVGTLAGRHLKNATVVGLRSVIKF